MKETNYLQQVRDKGHEQFYRAYLSGKTHDAMLILLALIAELEAKAPVAKKTAKKKDQK